MVTFTKGAACSNIQLTVAWPASCMAMAFFSSGVTILFFFSNPPTIRSTASKKSCLSTASLLFLAAINAASLHTLAMSAPENPGVCLAKKSVSKPSTFFSGFKCTSKISLRSRISGRSTKIWRSKRPARNKALSNTSARLVAANTITLELVPKPSISVSNWLSVFSRSSFPPEKLLFPRALPTASISSIKIIAGDFSLACLNKSRTLDAPTPTNISTKSEPDNEKKGTLASPATALANKVFPVPGGPTSRAPFGILPPKLVYFSGCFKNSTISWISSLAPSNPATSLKVVLMSVFSSNNLAFDFPILNICPPPPPAPPFILRIMTIQITMIIKIGSKLMRISLQLLLGIKLKSFSFPLATASSNFFWKISSFPMSKV